MKLTPSTVIFITGGASGLGEATVLKFHALGCKVFATDVSASKLNDLKSKLGKNIEVEVCDVSKED